MPIVKTIKGFMKAHCPKYRAPSMEQNTTIEESIELEQLRSQTIRMQQLGLMDGATRNSIERKCVDKIESNLKRVASLMVKGFQPSTNQMKGLPKSWIQSLTAITDAPRITPAGLNELISQTKLVMVPLIYTVDANKYFSVAGAAKDHAYYALVSVDQISIYQMSKYFDTKYKMELGELSLLIQQLTITLPILNTAENSAKHEAIQQVSQQLSEVHASQSLVKSSGIFGVFSKFDDHYMLESLKCVQTEPLDIELTLPDRKISKVKPNNLLYKGYEIEVIEGGYKVLKTDKECKTLQGAQAHIRGQIKN